MKIIDLSICTECGGLVEFTMEFTDRWNPKRNVEICLDCLRNAVDELELEYVEND